MKGKGKFSFTPGYPEQTTFVVIVGLFVYR